MKRPMSRVAAAAALSLTVVAIAGTSTSGAGTTHSAARLSCGQIKPLATAAYSTYSHTFFPRRSGFPGAAVAVAVPTGRSSAVHSCTYEFGDADYSTGSSVTTGTQFEIASITKLFTGALLEQEIDRHQMAGSDPISRYLPAGVNALACPGHAITLDELATHRSGLPDTPAGYRLATHASYTLPQLWAALGSARLQSCPGTRWSYSDFGFGLLGQLIVRAAKVKTGTTASSQGQAFGSLVAHVLTGPLHMTETQLEPLGADKNLATGYAHPGVVAPRWDNVGAMAGGGGLISSIADMATFLKASLGTGTKSVTGLLAATQKSIAPGNGKFEMGAAWQIYRQSWYPASYMAKAGGSSGMHSEIVIAPGLHAGVVILTNGPVYPLYMAEQILHDVTPGSKLPLGAGGSSANNG